MSESENAELHQLGNMVADLSDVCSGMSKDLFEVRRLMWAHLVAHCGSWEVAGNCYLQGIIGADRTRQDLMKKGGDA